MILINKVAPFWSTYILQNAADYWYIFTWNFPAEFLNILFKVYTYNEARTKYNNMIKLL